MWRFQAGQARWFWRCPRTCSAKRRKPRTRSPTSASKRILRHRIWSASASCWRLRNGRCCMVGGSGWDAKAASQVQAFAEASGLPVAASFRRQDYIDNDHPCYVGDAGYRHKSEACQDDTGSGSVAGSGRAPERNRYGRYALIEIPKPRQKLIRVYADPGELGRNYQADLPIAAGPRGFAAALAQVKPR